MKRGRESPRLWAKLPAMRWTPLLLAAVLLLSSRPARADETDPWWGRDKALHFGFSAGLAAGGYAAASLALDERWQRATVGAAFALTLGTAKELYDLSGHGNASWRDFTWDVIGTAVGTGVALLVDLAIAGNRRRDTTSMLIRF